MLAHSREVIKTNGEWDLADISVKPMTLELYDASYSEIQVNVRPLFCFFWPVGFRKWKKVQQYQLGLPSRRSS